MNSSNIASLFLLILIILSKSDALARVLLDSENPNPEKDTQNPDPQNPVDSQLNSSNSENVKDAAQFKLTENNTKDKEQIVSKDTSSNKDKTGDISKEMGGKSKSADVGKEENIGPLKTESIDKNEDLKGSDGTTNSESKERDKSSEENKEPKEKNNSSQGNGENNNETKQSNKSSLENGESKVESKESNGASESKGNTDNNAKPKESNDASESKGNNDNNAKPNESNDPSNNQEIGKKIDELKENNGTANSQENDKINNDSKEGNDSSNNKEKVKKNEEPITNTPSEGKMNNKKDAGVKEDIGPHKSGERDKGGKKESKDDGKYVPGKQEAIPTNNESLLDKPQVDTCDVFLPKCQMYDLVACLQHSEIDSRKLVISVQNTGDYSLTVNITVPPSVKIDSNMLNLAKHSSQKINISAYNTKSMKVVLNAGKGECAIQIDIGPSIADWLQQFPAYASQVTPTYVAYSLLFTLIIVGVVFGFCKFRRRGKRVDNGVQYQQLEMGNQIQSSNSEVVEASTVDGWNQGWDDDWDEEEQVSNSNLNGNLSSNGLSSRPLNRRSDWDVDWEE